MRLATAAAFLLGFLASNAALAQPQDLHFEDEPIPSGTYEATSTVSARNATIQSGSSVVFRAGQTVRLESGFKAELGASFRAEVDPDVGSGGGTCDLAALDLPPTVLNARFFPVYIAPTRHPSLSLNGFDCATSPTGCTSGLGLKQILEGYDPLSANDPITFPFSQTLFLAQNGSYEGSPSSRSEIQANTRRMQALAFEALASYVLEQNPGCDPSAFGLRAHATAVQELRQALTNGASWRIEKDYNNDGVKWPWLLGNAARTLDLYLALENAYEYYGNQGHQPSTDEYSGTTANWLLSRDDKRDVMKHHLAQMKRMEDAKTWQGYPGTLFDRYDSEAGNAPLKMQTATAYAALVWQDTFLDPGDQQENRALVRAYLERALEAAFRLSDDNRRHHFGYQTDGGKYFWAEGAYYFKFTFSDLLPFWHAVRANDLLNWYDPSLDADPFRDAPYTRPLHWLADTATPDAQSPPLDDGNKNPMRNAMLLRWTSDYGDEAIGRKFAWIANRTSNPGGSGVFGANLDLLLVELAIPRLGLSASEERAPANCVSDDPACAPGSGDDVQQLVIRREDGEGRTHFVLLNGERGAAITHGEGHEQPDNMQLLYYVDGASMLMDSGYDNAAGVNNSTWNHYYDHNVLNIAFGDYEYRDGYFTDSPKEAISGNPPEGGIEPPELKKLATPPRKNIGDHSVSELDHRQVGELDAFHARQGLVNFQPRAAAGPYERDVLFVGGTAPYLVDLNRAYATAGEGDDRLFRLNYYAKSRDLVVPNDWSADGGGFLHWNDVDEGTLGLYLYPNAIEYELRRDQSDVRPVEDLTWEDFSDPLILTRLDLQDDGEDQISFVSFIVPRASAPTNTPKMVRSRGSSRTYYQAWVWQQDPNTIDVYAARSMLEEFATPEFTFNLQEADPAFPDFTLVLGMFESFGFARLKQENGEWQIHPDYQINLNLPPPVTLKITNANQVGQSPELEWTWNEDPIPNAVFRVQRTTTAASWSQIGQPTTAMTYPDGSITIATPPSQGGDADDEYRYRILVEGRGYSNVASVFARDEPPYNSKVGSEIALTDQALEVIPDEYALDEAYPNPFNPSATIRFALPEAADVRLIVYDVMGREVARLVDSKKAAGYHRVRFDGARLASGLYLYRLVAKGEAGAFSKTGRMVLVK